MDNLRKWFKNNKENIFTDFIWALFGIGILLLIVSLCFSYQGKITNNITIISAFFMGFWIFLSSKDADTIFKRLRHLVAILSCTIVVLVFILTLQFLMKNIFIISNPMVVICSLLLLLFGTLILCFIHYFFSYVKRKYHDKVNIKSNGTILSILASIFTIVVALLSLHRYYLGV